MASPRSTRHRNPPQAPDLGPSSFATIKGRVVAQNFRGRQPTIPNPWAFLSKHWLATIFVVAGMILTWLAREPIVAFIRWISDRQAVMEVIQGYGAWAPLVYVFLVVLQTIVALLPGHPLVLAGAYVFGFVPALLLTVPSAVLSSELAFWIARRYGRPAAYRLASRKVIDRWEKISAGKGAPFFYLCFILPMTPGDAMCYVGGLGIISSSKFLVANILGRLTSSLFMTFVGARGQDLPPGVWIGAGVLALGAYAVWFVYVKKRRST